MASTAILIIVRNWGSNPRLLGFLANLDHFTAGVVTTLWTSAVRHFGFVTVGAFRGRTHMEKIMSAALVTARFGMTAFWVRHLKSL